MLRFLIRRMQIDMDELFRRLRASANPEGSYAVGEYGHSYKLLTHKDAENIIRYLKQYSEIRQKVEEFHRKTTKEKPIETAIELQTYLKELEAHERCLANQVLDIFSEVN